MIGIKINFEHLNDLSFQVSLCSMVNFGDLRLSPILEYLSGSASVLLLVICDSLQFLNLVSSLIVDLNSIVYAISGHITFDDLLTKNQNAAADGHLFYAVMPFD